MVESPVTTPTKTAEASPKASQAGLSPAHVQALISVAVSEKNRSAAKKQKVYLEERSISFYSRRIAARDHLHAIWRTLPVWTGWTHGRNTLVSVIRI
jgi:hypothetical protein